jgi:glycogen synthase
VKILIASHAFSPGIGGIETCSMDLAGAFSKLGHEVQIITQTPSENPTDNCGLRVIRQPRKLVLLRTIRWCGVYFQNNVSLQTVWPLLFARRPWVVCTQTWLKGGDGLNVLLRWLVLRLATNIYISKAIRDQVGYAGFIIPNPYNNEVFRLIPGITRERSLVFLGRLVSDKGCDLLIESLAMLQDAGLAIPLTFIGDGPEKKALKKLVAAKGLGNSVRFTGVLKGEALATELNRHQVLVVPSRWEEPFGMVALEGIACGCVVVGSKRGGLAEAIGPCGIVFENGDIIELARSLRTIIENRDLANRCRQAAPGHLQNYKLETVANRYLNVFRECIAKRQLEC